MKRRINARERREIALHEARHAVSKIVWGLPFTLVAIDVPGAPMTGTRLGGVAHAEAHEWLTGRIIEGDRETLISYVASVLVGYLGAGPWWPDLSDGRPVAGNWPPDYVGAYDTDVERLGRRMAALRVEPLEYEEARLRAFHFHVEAACTAAVEAVAAALLDDEDGSLSRREVEEIAAPHLSALTVKEAEALTKPTETEEGAR